MKIKNDNPMFAGDLEFRVFALDISNICACEPNRNDLEGALINSVDQNMPYQSHNGISYELLLKLGLDLCVPIETQDIAGKPVCVIVAGA